MKHRVDVEERIFGADIQALRAYDKGFNEAWQSNMSYTLEIKLTDIFQICPRSYQRTLMYARLVKFLQEGKNITLKVVSRKTKHETI